MLSWVILVIGAFMFVLVMLNMPTLQALQVVATDLSPYTANTTYWLGFTETMDMIPLIIIVLIILFTTAAWWKARQSGE